MLINAALKVFALNGYRHASTDDIVREAAISKGLLFHYFENKLGVYAFVYDYSVRYLLLELSTAVDAKETDLFTLMQQVETGKMHAMCGYPYLQPFLNRAQAENVNEALVAVEERKQQMEEAYENIRWKVEADYSRIFVVRTFVVHPSFLQMGVGRALMDFSLELAVNSGMKSIRLDVYEKNFPAISLYEKCGFEYIDTVDLGLGHYGLDWFKLYEKVI